MATKYVFFVPKTRFSKKQRPMPNERNFINGINIYKNDRFPSAQPKNKDKTFKTNFNTTTHKFIASVLIAKTTENLNVLTFTRSAADKQPKQTNEWPHSNC